MEKQNWKLTNISEERNGIVYYRIIATNDVGETKKGEYGAFVESFKNIENCGDADIRGGYIRGGADIRGGVIRGGDISGDAVIRGGYISGGDISGGDISGGVIRGDAVIRNQEMWFLACGVGSENGDLAAYMTKENTIEVTRGCFVGSLEEFKNKVNEVHANNTQINKQYMLLIQVIEDEFEKFVKCEVSE